MINVLANAGYIVLKKDIRFFGFAAGARCHKDARCQVLTRKDLMAIGSLVCSIDL